MSDTLEGSRMSDKRDYPQKGDKIGQNWREIESPRLPNNQRRMAHKLGFIAQFKIILSWFEM